jgi:hypothetical protein
VPGLTTPAFRSWLPELAGGYLTALILICCQQTWHGMALACYCLMTQLTQILAPPTRTYWR